MANKPAQNTFGEIYDDIVKRINKALKEIQDVESQVGWLVLAKDRFKEGQRVQYSARAFRSGAARGRGKNSEGTGMIAEVSNDFSIMVQLDGRKKPTRFHHALFERVGGKR